MAEQNMQSCSAMGIKTTKFYIKLLVLFIAQPKSNFGATTGSKPDLENCLIVKPTIGASLQFFNRRSATNRWLHQGAKKQLLYMKYGLKAKIGV